MVLCLCLLPTEEADGAPPSSAVLACSPPMPATSNPVATSSSSTSIVSSFSSPPPRSDPRRRLLMPHASPCTCGPLRQVGRVAQMRACRTISGDDTISQGCNDECRVARVRHNSGKLEYGGGNRNPMGKEWKWWRRLGSRVWGRGSADL